MTDKSISKVHLHTAGAQRCLLVFDFGFSKAWVFLDFVFNLLTKPKTTVLVLVNLAAHELERSLEFQKGVWFAARLMKRKSPDVKLPVSRE